MVKREDEGEDEDEESEDQLQISELRCDVLIQSLMRYHGHTAQLNTWLCDYLAICHRDNLLIVVFGQDNKQVGERTGSMVYEKRHTKILNTVE